jgi:hypothetical protein
MVERADYQFARQGPPRQGPPRWQLGLLSLVVSLLSACGVRGPRVPPVTGSLADVIVEASFTGEEAPARPGALILDSVAFGQLARLTGTAMAPTRAHSLIDPIGVLECPPREPCRVRNDAVFLTIWDAVRLPDGQLDVVVSRTHNVRRLYVMTESVTHELRLRPEGGAWRLVRRARLPG